ncbi:hypothetical protein SAMD00079811_24060 [Scytonema sp. HK-05]|nr:hypothetical protein SAMD00079811_24060 [Scytonema sp. HK-05]
MEKYRITENKGKKNFTSGLIFALPVLIWSRYF